jgi:glucose-1-phosphate cytidylyltransferase
LKVVILAGGFGTRLTEETELRPKPLVEIGGKPILWHVMKIFEAGGFNDFIICCGYKGQLIKSYFVNYFTENYDISVSLERHSVEFLGKPCEKWKVTLIDTGLETLTGGRIKRIAPHVGNETFCLTYGDGVARVDVGEIVRFHRGHGRKATVTAVPAPGRFGVLDLAEPGNVKTFREKPDDEIGWINGGFFVCEPSVFDYIEGDATSWERTPLERLSAEGELMAFRHTGFWKPMDTLRDKRELEELWATGRAPWKTW